MDANGLRFWLVEGSQFVPDAARGVEPLPASRRLRLTSTRDPGPDTATRAEADELLKLTPQTLDGFGARARWDADTRTVLASGPVPPEMAIYAAGAGETISDLAMGRDGVLYLALGSRLVLQDRRNRWDPQPLSLVDFDVWRLAIHPEGGVWVLDRVHRQLARAHGLPLPHTAGVKQYTAGTFRPNQENPDPPVLEWVASAAFGGEDPVAIASIPGGRLALLTWVDGGDARIRLLDAGQHFGAPITLKGARFPYSFRWVSEAAVAIRLRGLREAPEYAIDERFASAAPSGSVYPLRDAPDAPLPHTPDYPAQYVCKAGTRPLLPLSLASYARFGTTAARTIDSHKPQTEWHRLYLEADIPPRCGIRLKLAASDRPVPPAAAGEWFDHLFGLKEPGLPSAAWLRARCELPIHPGVLGCDPVPNRTGLFTVLIQRSGRAVRTLRGRYLFLRLELTGDGRVTPEVAAVRAYESRFSYVNHYLPEIYRESVFGPDADAVAPATPADFLERLLDNFEGVLTPLEDAVAGSYLLTDPRSTREDALEWLASWIGLSFDPAVARERRRALLSAAPALYRAHGTLGGLAQSLDLLTDGLVASGNIVLLENYRLRRTFATILGADLNEAYDPLLAGLAAPSGHSVVGDTLFLGEEYRKEFLALFEADLPKTAGEQAAVATLFEKLAWRLSILVQRDLDATTLDLIRRVVQMETPAHVLAQVVPASTQFLIGASSLVNVDTYLRRKPPILPVRVEQSRIGVRDVLTGLPTLDPRIAAGAYSPAAVRKQKPHADPGPDLTVNPEQPLHFDASRSSAAPGRKIVKYFWTLIE